MLLFSGFRNPKVFNIFPKINNPLISNERNILKISLAISAFEEIRSLHLRFCPEKYLECVLWVTSLVSALATILLGVVGCVQCQLTLVFFFFFFFCGRFPSVAFVHHKIFLLFWIHWWLPEAHESSPDFSEGPIFDLTSDSYDPTMRICKGFPLCVSCVTILCKESEDISKESLDLCQHVCMCS